MRITGPFGYRFDDIAVGHNGDHHHFFKAFYLHGTGTVLNVMDGALDNVDLPASWRTGCGSELTGQNKNEVYEQTV